MNREPARSQRSLAEKLNHLLETIRRPDGTKYSDQDVATWMTEHWDEFAEADDDGKRRGVSGTYIGYLRRGQRRQISASIVVGLARFFGVDASYLLPGGEREDAIHEQLALLHEARELGLLGFSARGPASSSATRLKAIRALLAQAASEIEHLAMEQDS
jgi:transcriptional regulator with XRE-family HTH domain